MDFGNIYNSLGLRVGKTDSTGTYSYVCDGTTPGSPVLIDGHTLYTPGLSENRGGTSVYYDFDRLGNLWTADGTGKSQYAAVDYSAFGITLAGSAGTPFGYGGANGCQTDLDASLVLMGHRYFDPRTGRFINQDPIGDGDNWYAYAGNNPVNDVDPSGLYATWPGDGIPFPPGDLDRNIGQLPDGTYDIYTSTNGRDSSYLRTITVGTGFVRSLGSSGFGGTPGGGMFAQPGRAPGRQMPPLSAYKDALRQLHAKYGKIPKVGGQVGRKSSLVRILGKKRYRLDPGHPNATAAGEKGIHFNYEDYTNGKSNTGRAIEETFPVRGGEGVMAEDIPQSGFIGAAEADAEEERVAILIEDALEYLGWL